MEREWSEHLTLIGIIIMGFIIMIIFQEFYILHLIGPADSVGYYHHHHHPILQMRK